MRATTKLPGSKYPGHSRLILTVCLALVASALTAPWNVAQACNTPVNRYALYQWEPTSYVIFHVYRDAPGDAAAAIRKKLESYRTPEDLDDLAGSTVATPGADATPDSAAAESKVANVSFLAIDLEEERDVAELPPALAQSLQETPAEELPTFVVINPHGREVYRGEIDASEIEALIDSPARQKMAQLLHEGHDGVLMLLRSADAEKNQRALAEMRAAVREVAPKEGEGDDSAAAKEPAQSLDDVLFAGEDPEFTVATMEIPRDDPAEKWFVRQLLVSDSRPLNDEEKAEPMVFAAYGRGRVMYPYLGRGIESSNLLNVIHFVNGPCSCQVKDENPGVDLLTHWDWERTARVTAQRVGQETGNEPYLGDGGVWDVAVLTPISIEEEDTTSGDGEAAGEDAVTPSSTSDSPGAASSVESNEEPRASETAGVANVSDESGASETAEDATGEGTEAGAKVVETAEGQDASDTSESSAAETTAEAIALDPPTESTPAPTVSAADAAPQEGSSSGLIILLGVVVAVVVLGVASMLIVARSDR